jgi:8-oxo-dGTP pyrophosphatase MutT (NUDIX family)
VSYAYALRPDRIDGWEGVYGPGVEHVSVVAFAAEVPHRDPTLDPSEHETFAWCSYDEAHALLDWPIEKDALAGRREALGILNARLRS